MSNRPAALPALIALALTALSSGCIAENATDGSIITIASVSLSFVAALIAVISITVALLSKDKERRQLATSFATGAGIILVVLLLVA